jgi:hypothetical protein
VTIERQFGEKEEGGEGSRRTGNFFTKFAFSDVHPSATVEVRVEHELEEEGDVVLEDVELRIEHRTAPQDLGETLLGSRIDGVNLEEGLITDVVAIEGDTLAEYDEGDILRLLRLALLAGKREFHRPVERRSEV